MRRILFGTLALLGMVASTHADVLSIVTDRPGTFTDISGSGTFIDSTDDSEHNIVTTVGNTAFPAGNVRIGNNGVALAGVTTGEIGFTNADILAVGNPSGIPTNGGGLLPLWDDHIPTAEADSGIYWQEIGNTLIIQWNKEDHFSAPGTGTITFQLQVFGGATGTATRAQYIYSDLFYSDGATVNNAGSATIGYVTGTLPHNNVATSFNTVIDPSTVYSLIPEPASLLLLSVGALGLLRRR